MERPTCPECQRQHGPGILCATFAAWEDNAHSAATSESRLWANNAEQQLAQDGGWRVPGLSPDRDE